jgi:RND family efflux transporter MFP subunit
MMPRPFATVVLIACFGLVACGRKELVVDASQPSDGPLVQSIVAESKSRPVFEEVVGSVRAKSVASIEAKVSGRIAKMHVDLGQRVAKDQLLAEIDAKEVKAQYDRALANRDQAQRDYKRFADLLQKQITSHQEFDAVEARFRVAEAALREAESMLGYVEVHSPFEGVVVRKLADTGDFAAPGKPILQIENPEKLRFEADVPEALIDTVRSGSRVDVLISSLSGPLHGTVSDISPTADQVSRTFLVRVELPGEKGCKAGQFGRALFPTGNYSSIGVPASAVVLRGQMEMVFIDDGGRARLRLVKTGKRFGDEVELISGVAPGERVIMEHAQDLKDGQAVRMAP